MRFLIALLVAVFVVMIAAICECNADEVTLQWDYGDTVIDGFRIYSGPMGQFDDGTWGPKLNDTPLVDNIGSEQREVLTSQPGWAGQSKKFCFVARAFRGSEESLDSNVVCIVVDNTPLIPPADLAGTYSDDMIEISWTQADAIRAHYWIIYYRIGDRAFVQLDRVDNIGQEKLQLTKTFDAVEAGMSADVQFAIVAFKNTDVFSSDSEILTITVDRSDVSVPIPPVENLRFKVMVPVQ